MPCGRLVTPASTCWTLAGALAKEHEEDHATRGYWFPPQVIGEAAGDSLPRVSATVSTSAAGTHDGSRFAFVALQSRLR
jgi:hypothetical protein